MAFGDSVVNDSTDGLTKTQGTLVDGVMDAAISPLAFFTKSGESEEYVSKKTCGAAAIGYFIGGVMVGDRWGDSIPIIGGKRV